MARLTDLRSGP